MTEAQAYRSEHSLPSEERLLEAIGQAYVHLVNSEDPQAYELLGALAFSPLHIADEEGAKLWFSWIAKRPKPLEKGEETFRAPPPGEIHYEITREFLNELDELQVKGLGLLLRYALALEQSEELPPPSLDELFDPVSSRRMRVSFAANQLKSAGKMTDLTPPQIVESVRKLDDAVELTFKGVITPELPKDQRQMSRLRKDWSLTAQSWLEIFMTLETVEHLEQADLLARPTETIKLVRPIAVSEMTEDSIIRQLKNTTQREKHLQATIQEILEAPDDGSFFFDPNFEESLRQEVSDLLQQKTTVREITSVIDRHLASDSYEESMMAAHSLESAKKIIEILPEMSFDQWFNVANLLNFDHYFFLDSISERLSEIFEEVEIDDETFPSPSAALAEAAAYAKASENVNPQTSVRNS